MALCWQFIYLGMASAKSRVVSVRGRRILRRLCSQLLPYKTTRNRSSISVEKGPVNGGENAPRL